MDTFDPRLGRKYMKSLSLPQKVCFVLYLFMAIFQPNVLKVGTFKIILLVDFLIFGFMLLKYQKIVFNKKILLLFAGFLPFVFYLFVSVLIHSALHPEMTSAYVNNFISSVIPLFHAAILCLVMVLLMKVKRIDYSDIEKMLLYVCLLQLACVILALFSSRIRDVFINIMLSDMEANRIKDFLRFGSTRMYGLARNLFDLFGYIVSILISLVFLKGVSENNNKYKIMAVVLLIIPLLNARTGLVLSIAGFAVVIAFYYTPKKIPYYIIDAVAIVAIVIALFSLLPERNVEWLTKGFEDTLTYLKTGEKVGVYSQILEADIVYPSNYLLGDCGAPEVLEGYSGIDSGYIQCLWRFGIIGSALLFIGYLNMFLMAAVRNRSKKAYCTIAVLAMLFFVYLVKLYALENAGANILVFGIPSLLLVCDKIDGSLTYNRIRTLLKGERING